jgi:phenylalanyl-tRNA synthetase beta subunit
LPNQRLEVYSGKKLIGEYGNLENGLFYYEFDLEKLNNSKKIVKKYKDIPMYPPQVEDITLQIPEKTYIGEVINSINSVNRLITKVTLTDIFDDCFTFNIEYQHPDKTLVDSEVKEIRNKILEKLRTKFGISIKEI